jgi:hypothetical protein
MLEIPHSVSPPNPGREDRRVRAGFRTDTCGRESVVYQITARTFTAQRLQ